MGDVGGKPVQIKKILVGMYRPTEDEIMEMWEARGVDGYNYFWCPCFDPQIAGQDKRGFESHWLAGHYDTPVYKYLWEENGKIVESLEEPWLPGDHVNA